MKRSRLRVGVFLGGASSEREISLRSGKAVLDALRRVGYEVVAIDPRDSRQALKSLAQIDLAFLALHGRGGEDGTLQAQLEAAGIPYVGSGPEASRLAFSKVEAKKVFGHVGIPTPCWRTVCQENWRELKGFPLPFFVKPVADGSSIGVFRVEDFRRSAEKIMRALRRYGELLVEEQISGREFTVGILGDQALPVVELRPKRAFYDFRAKYTRGLTEYFVPAPIPQSWKRRFQELALNVHESLGLRDFSRIDLMADSHGRPFVLEANSIPGFTELSLLPKAAQEAGIFFDGLCSRLVEMAWKRQRQTERLEALVS